MGWDCDTEDGLEQQLELSSLTARVMLPTDEEMQSMKGLSGGARDTVSFGIETLPPKIPELTFLVIVSVLRFSSFRF